jgi:aspartyl-tRNA(Asn)/glutamyl-tRNA(Gln) amidotransferase subunit C
MKKLDKKDVSHVIDLAALEVDEKEIEKYQEQLNDILNEIKKIENANVDDLEIMISPSTNINRYNTAFTTHLKKEEVLLKASLSDDDFIIVSKVLDE